MYTYANFPTSSKVSRYRFESSTLAIRADALLTLSYPRHILSDTINSLVCIIRSATLQYCIDENMSRVQTLLLHG